MSSAASPNNHKPQGPREKARALLRQPRFLWAVALLSLALLLFGPSAAEQAEEVPLSEIRTAIAEGKVSSAKINDANRRIDLELEGGDKVYSSYAFDQGQVLQEELQEADVESTVSNASGLSNVLTSLLPTIFFILLILFVFLRMAGPAGAMGKFSKSKARLNDADTPTTTFADVAGCEEALTELVEIRDILADPTRYTSLGAKIPKGVLLVGPPGTGKTLLARAVAGEAGVPFYSISGSDFVEMFVGVGAGRVRDLFQTAKANAPCIVFIDEIDAVGRQRGAGVGGGNDEREQTLNALLVEMDGFDASKAVIVMAATNRPDVLDPALLRPGRFDRQVVVDRPDIKGREQILAVHAKGKPIAPGIDLSSIARSTPGFTGADLANLLNEAALLTARAGEKLISQAQLQEAVERVVAGPERKTRLMSESERKIIAYHEGGHALVAHALSHADPVHKVTILPRGRALGYTMTLPVSDKFLRSRSELLDELAMLLGGRSAEELVFHEPTTGAANDIEKATAIARAMITEYGMSDLLGARKLSQPEGDVFLGKTMAAGREYSESLAAMLDAEVARLLDEAHDEAHAVLEEYRDVLDALVVELLEHETLDRAAVERVFASVVKRPGRGRYAGVPVRDGASAADSARKRLPSQRPPVLTATEMAAAHALELEKKPAPVPAKPRSRTRSTARSDSSASEPRKSPRSRKSASPEAASKPATKPAARATRRPAT